MPRAIDRLQGLCHIFLRSHDIDIEQVLPLKFLNPSQPFAGHRLSFPTCGIYRSNSEVASEFVIFGRQEAVRVFQFRNFLLIHIELGLSKVVIFKHTHNMKATLVNSANF